MPFSICFSTNSHQEMESNSLPFESELALWFAIANRICWKLHCVGSKPRLYEAFHTCIVSWTPASTMRTTPAEGWETTWIRIELPDDCRCVGAPRQYHPSQSIILSHRIMRKINVLCCMELKFYHFFFYSIRVAKLNWKSF